MLGGIGEATATLFQEAGSARAYGLMSLTQLNRSLVGDAGLSHFHVRPHGSRARAQ